MVDFHYKKSCVPWVGSGIVRGGSIFWIEKIYELIHIYFFDNFSLPANFKWLKEATQRGQASGGFPLQKVMCYLGRIGQCEGR